MVVVFRRGIVSGFRVVFRVPVAPTINGARRPRTGGSAQGLAVRARARARTWPFAWPALRPAEVYTHSETSFARCCAQAVDKKSLFFFSFAGGEMDHQQDAALSVLYGLAAGM